MYEIVAILFYFFVLLTFAKLKHKRSLNQHDFIIGGRSLNKWTTALAAHASDMSNWLFMGYPGVIFLYGGQQVWIAFGLILVMWFNWTYIAPKIRKDSETHQSVTLCGFFEKRLGHNWPIGRLVTSLALFIFYTVYVSAILTGVGMLLTALFPLSYNAGISIGIVLVLPFLLLGGYLTLAHIDLFQGIFLLGVIIFVPLYILTDLGGANHLITAVQHSGKTFNPFNANITTSLMLMLSWGLGYLGQPHILTKFMGIKDPKHLPTSRTIGMTWQTLSLGAATLVGFVGITALPSLNDPEKVFIALVRENFSPLISGLFLSAILAAVINAISSILLVLSTTITEDLYKRFTKTPTTQSKQLLITRLACIFSACIALCIALPNFTSINTLVHYAWSGLGSTFGPLVIASLFFSHLTKTGAWVGMTTGVLLGLLWPFAQTPIPALVIAFPTSLLVTYITSHLTIAQKA